MKTCIIYLYICIVKIILWMCHHKTLEKLKTSEFWSNCLDESIDNCT